MNYMIFRNGIEFMTGGGEVAPEFPGIPEEEIVIAELVNDDPCDPLYEYEAVEVDGVMIARNTGVLKEVDEEGDAQKLADYQLIKYGFQRSSADGGYPDIGDQLDDLFHKGAFSDEMAAKIQSIKDKFPKPE